MNNFLVSQKENKRYGVWLWVIVLAALVISVWPVTVTPITGYNGLDAMQQLLTADYIRIPFTAIYWIAFFWDRPVDGHLLRHRYGAGRMARSNARRVLQRNGVATGGHRHPFGSFRSRDDLGGMAARS